MRHESLGTAAHKKPYHPRAQVAYLLVRVGDTGHDILAAGTPLVAEKVEEEPFHLVGRKDFQFVGVFDIHHLITDVVGRLDHIDQRMAGIARRIGSVGGDDYAELVGDAAKRFALRREKTEFVAVAGQSRREGIFHNRGQHRIGHCEAPLTAPVKLMGQQSEGIGIPLEMHQIGPLRRSKFIAEVGSGPL